MDKYASKLTSDDLKNLIMVNHLMAEDWYVKSMEKVPFITGFTGKKIKVKNNNQGQMTVNGAKIVTPDFLAINGVFHHVDQIIQN